MATTTPNLGLVKPATTDGVNINVINENMDKLDAVHGQLVNIQEAVTTSATLAPTGISFTLTKRAIVDAAITYLNVATKEIMIANGDSSASYIQQYARAETTTAKTVSWLRVTAVLEPGTYYVWGRWASAAASGGYVNVKAWAI